jgi:monoamine oxidase
MVLADLVAYWGPEASSPLDLVEHPWNAEPWSGGAFTSFVTPGTWTSHARLAAAGPGLDGPIGEDVGAAHGSAGAQGSPGPAAHGRVLWAGTEVSPRWPGYFEGAIEAGEQAAAAVLER